ncbi:MAG: ABC transporter permease [Clostridium sp.]
MKILALVNRIIIQTLRDKRTLALIMLAPLLLITLVNYIFTSTTDTNLKVGVYDLPKDLQTSLSENSLDLEVYDNNSNIYDKIKDDSLKAFIYKDGESYSITYENSTPMDSSKVKSIFLSTLSKEGIETLKTNFLKLNPSMKDKFKEIDIKSDYLYGDESLTFFDTFNPTLIGFFVFFFVFIIAGISILKERTTKTLEKLLSTSIKRYEILLGYLLGYGIFAIIQTVIIVLYSIYVLDMKIVGNISLVILTNVLISFVALSLGIFLSTFATSEFQMLQFIPVIIVPQIFFTGLIPIDSMSPLLQNLAHFVPLYYGADILQQIMIKGNGLAEIGSNLLCLLVFAIIIYLLNLLGLKKYRSI